MNSNIVFPNTIIVNYEERFTCLLFFFNLFLSYIPQDILINAKHFGLLDDKKTHWEVRDTITELIHLK